MSERRVHRVRLQAPTEALARRGAMLLEDALRTASMPDASPGRLLVFRSLSVGTIRSDLPPSSLALQIEDRVRLLASSAVYALDPSAPTHDVVYFRDDAECFVICAAELARGATPGAWFWRLSIPGYEPSLTRDEALRAALFGAFASTAGRAAVLRIVIELEAQGTLLALFDALRWQDGRTLLRAFGASMPEPGLPWALWTERTAEMLFEPRLRALVQKVVGTFGPDDARSVWAAAMMLAIEHPARLVDPALFSKAHRAIHQLLGPTISASATPEAPSEPSLSPRHVELDRQPGSNDQAKPNQPVTPQASSPAISSRTAASLSTSTADQPHERSGPAQSVPDAPTVHPERSFASKATAQPEPSSRPIDDSVFADAPVPTIAGGLLFLVPLFTRFGIDTMLAEHPELLDLDFSAQVFLYVAKRLNVPEQDPMRLVWGTPSLLNPRVSVELPQRLREWGQPGSELESPRHLRDLFAAFHLVARRVSRRRVRLGLRDIVLRPARMTATRTHIDVLFDHRQADIRIRRAGLDVDPGWVPWLGRVVRYHYLYGEFQR